MAGVGGVFETDAPIRIALTGAPMAARLDDQTLAWNASHAVAPGQRLSIGAARTGVYGYLHVGGGIDAPLRLGARAVHLTCGLGRAVQAGDRFAIGADKTPDSTGWRLDVADRFAGGTARMLASAQTALFSAATLARFESTVFTRDPRGNRQGVRLGFDGDPFAGEGQLSILSEVIIPGDIQMTGDGMPFVLLPECHVTGGYPRIGAVVPDDLPMVAQAGPGAQLRFRLITLAQAIAAHRTARAAIRDLPRALRPLVRDPHDIRDLLSYQLIGGAITGWD
jgi:allophanate hydrolase subunit 2